MISFVRIDPELERNALVDFMTQNTWPFHVKSTLTADTVVKAIADGAYRSADCDSYWIEHQQLGRIGFLRLEDLQDPTPVFDLRLAEEFRGRGLAKQILSEATVWVFKTFPEISRFEGQTRDDNIAMRKTFTGAGWVKEAYYRQGWPVEGEAPRASVAYAVLRGDLESGTVTPVPWDEEY